MDLVSHALWAGAAGMALRRRNPAITGRMIGAMVALAVAPDVLQMLPVVVASAADASPLRFLYTHATALPGAEPKMPAWAHFLSHHLHCVLHSAIVAGAVTLVLFLARRGWLPALLGWWLHIVLDVPTHSEGYYPVPILYPLTYWGVNGVAWTNPAVVAVNFAGLAAAYAALFASRRKN